MFSVQPFEAKRHAVYMDGGKTIEKWEACTVIGVDATRDEPKYIVEVRDGHGACYVDRADLIRKVVAH